MKRSDLPKGTRVTVIRPTSDCYLGARGTVVGRCFSKAVILRLDRRPDACVYVPNENLRLFRTLEALADCAE
jgi:hypothetical protein